MWRPPNTQILGCKRFALQGDDECLDLDKELSGGLFLNTLQNLVFEIQPDTARLAKKMPKNAKYLSSDIQK